MAYQIAKVGHDASKKVTRASVRKNGIVDQSTAQAECEVLNALVTPEDILAGKGWYIVQDEGAP